MTAERTVSRADLGDAWPLTVESGTLRCKPFLKDLHLLTFEAEGQVWALNGTAAGQGFPFIDPIWADNPEIAGAKINIRPLLELAQSLCETPTSQS